MTDDPGTWVVVSLELVAALVFAAFWITWFRQDHDQPWLPEGYRDHEAPFVFSDSVLTALLVASAVLLILEEPLGASLALVAGGMLVFLSVLDAAYFARTKMFAREHDGLANLGIVVAAITLGLILIVRFA